MEDTEGRAGCLFEHGLSFYVETKEHRLLLDFGASEKTIVNAEKLGVDLSQVDIPMLSHGHYDHSGGMTAFTKVNSNAKIYMQRTACREYFSEKNEEKHYTVVRAYIDGFSGVYVFCDPE